MPIDQFPPVSYVRRKLRPNGCSTLYLLQRILRPSRRKRNVPTKRQLTFNGLHGIMPQKTELFLTTALRTINLTHRYRQKKLQAPAIETFLISNSN
jgi:hypothetical protein